MNDSKPRQVFRTLLSIEAESKNAAVWMVFTCPLISKSLLIYIDVCIKHFLWESFNENMFQLKEETLFYKCVVKFYQESNKKKKKKCTKY